MVNDEWKHPHPIAVPLRREEGSLSEAAGVVVSLASPELLLDQFEHAIRIVKYMVVLNSQYLHAHCRQKSLASLISGCGRRAVVRGSFKLDHQALRGAIEVNDVWPNTVLPPELSTVHL